MMGEDREKKSSVSGNVSESDVLEVEVSIMNERLYGVGVNIYRE